MLLVVLVLIGQREGLDLGIESMGPAIDHEGLDTSLNKYMGLKRKGMLHMELLEPPMLLYQPMILLRLINGINRYDRDTRASLLESVNVAVHPTTERKGKGIRNRRKY